MSLLTIGVSEMSLRKDIVLGEIAGKNVAVHAYDKISWMIRTGYLTLFYSGRAVALNVVDKGGDLSQYEEIVLSMSNISV